MSIEAKSTIPASLIHQPEVLAYLNYHKQDVAGLSFSPLSGQCKQLMAVEQYHQSVDALTAQLDIALQDLATAQAELQRNKVTIAGMNEAHAKLAGMYEGALSQIKTLTASPTFNLCRCGDQRLPAVTLERNSLGPFWKAACPACKHSVSTFTEPGLVQLWNALSKVPRPMPEPTDVEGHVGLVTYTAFWHTYVSGYENGKQDTRTSNCTKYNPSGAAHKSMALLASLAQQEQNAHE
ncbi:MULTISPECIES: hypothetical protein [Pseudomonas]|jgi:hypothetical protein|uniref:Uncharacterized protein n=1 Tax=Pseudomonas asiatica TaxID=2219225 RepID=A0A9X4DB66_9PSED|nr:MULTISPECIES: hypothetical protein [Pseudomonas]MCG3646579.1 hypothetical protein [Pseudomonas putida]MDD2113493.1 hypothetical protein [Pseudomonas asiatica]TFW21507.1 hypothetical protein E4L40_18970 [Pseudomonas putida]